MLSASAIQRKGLPIKREFDLDVLQAWCLLSTYLPESLSKEKCKNI
jgi:hypothetical protein